MFTKGPNGRIPVFQKYFSMTDMFAIYINTKIEKQKRYMRARTMIK